MPILLVPPTNTDKEAFQLGKSIHIMQNSGLQFSGFLTADHEKHINTAQLANQYFKGKGLKTLAITVDNSTNERKENESRERAFSRSAKAAFAALESYKNKGLEGIVIFIATQTLYQSLNHTFDNTCMEETASQNYALKSATPYLLSDAQEASFKNALADMEQQGLFT